jgi:hypothetical protein
MAQYVLWYPPTIDHSLKQREVLQVLTDFPEYRRIGLFDRYCGEDETTISSRLLE